MSKSIGTFQKSIINKRKCIEALCFVLLFSFLFFSGTAVCAVSPEWTGGVAIGFSGGTGTKDDPYLISTGEELAYLSQQVNNGTSYTGQYFKLTQDILLNRLNADGTFVSQPDQRNEFTSIGSMNEPFNGNFNGNGYEIIGLYINKNWVDYQGLFGYAGTRSVIQDLKVSGSIAGHDKTGSIAGYTNGLITGCSSDCAITIKWAQYHGGIAGYAEANSVISNCTVCGTVEGKEYVGGAVGYTEGKIIDCTGDNVVSGYQRVGGMAGYAAGIRSEISNCTFFGTILGTGSYYLGGIAGQIDGIIADCTISATLTSSNGYVGGVAGYASGVDSRIVDCIVSGTVTAGGNGYAGGVAGQTDGEITGCTVNVEVSAPNSYIGGVAGYSKGADSIISDCTVSGTVTGTAGEGYVGGVAGQTDGTITKCTCDCTVSGVHHYVGGVVGYAGTGSEVSNSSSAGDVSGNSEVGGIAGYTNGIIKICINTGDVTGRNGHTGGVAGQAGDNSIVSNSYNSGAIDGGNGKGGIGGIVGYVGQSTIVHHNLNNGTVEGNKMVGCIIGNSIDQDNVWNNYYYDYENAPEGTNNGDIEDNDGAIPIGDLTWEEVQDLLNGNNNPDGDDIWNQDLDDNGVPKPGLGAAFKIINSVIKAGRYYTVASLGTDTSEATITSESVFTVYFKMCFNTGCEPEEQILRIKNNNEEGVELPVGTSIIMLAEVSAEGSYSYYYINLTTPTDTITLDEFIKMGSTTEHYNSAPAAEDDEKEYLFIFDFSNVASENQISPDSYKIELLTPNESYSGTPPIFTITGKNTYTLTVHGGTDTCTVSLGQVAVAGYDEKTAGKVWAGSFYLEKDGVKKPIPPGTRINGKTIASTWSEHFIALTLGDNTISFDLSNCLIPLESGEYTLGITAYACSDLSLPRAGFAPVSGSTLIQITKPKRFAIRVQAETRVFDYSEPISVPYAIKVCGTGNVEAVLQRKYGMVYVTVSEEATQLDDISNGEVNLTVPESSPKGTYRFLFTLRDASGRERAQSTQSFIIK